MIFVAFILQYSVIARISFLNCAPDLMLILTIVFGYSRGKNAGILVGFFGGMMMDLFFCQALGFNALIFIILGFICGFYTKFFYTNNIAAPIVILIIASFAYCFAYYIFWYVLKAEFHVWYCFVHMILPEVILTLVAGLILLKPLLALVKKMYAFEELEEQEIR